MDDKPFSVLVANQVFDADIDTKTCTHTPDSPTAVRQYVAIPPLQLVRTTYFIQSLLTWSKAQMIRVVETEVATCPG